MKNGVSFQWVAAVALVGSLWGCAGSMSPPDSSLAIAPNEQWQILQNEGIQLEIPPGFVAGVPGLQLEELQASLVAGGFDDRTDWLAQNAEKIDLLAFQKSGDQLATLNVVRAGRSPEETLENYLDQQVSRLEAAGIVVESQIVERDGKVGELRLTGTDQQQIIYVYPSTEDFWVLTYSGGESLAENTIERISYSVEILTESE
ncbi:hypothetical protein Lepto7376_0091 [[Leptolyngbya] sp. PCC 7376]|uniref:hypothetical protein n=1 Tax=[Leptolyngbya] sp. PCC 7376 TaxID=111781 RepID=UPI00029F3289|nr:hypothetical protein [[Leptolyngbya] sp. PCC 7376]AFY36541.1 hypothetical protein Lepto7376_0091 [[Leptolyngbya] sp. PCC 7376]